ncbi:hypothetical protein AMS68_001924 [Peltaster fructicola]|uniref:NAD-dependent epimerase/dehydratase domain-containing protein n=1 Tax=Peltaster fructicola TaxID=286661 RepID=A0A6H0XNS1_9PEZI|nr:hypothetical protein AMS68_001924 [Peltaster fructicola]
MASKELVLVTGGSGFIGSWCLLYVLQQGYRARTTVRSLGRADEVRQLLVNGGVAQAQADAVEFVAADLKSDKEGTLRVLRAAKTAGVRRVVITSSFAACGYGHPPQDAPFTELDWTDLSGRAVPAYQKSKTIAERAAWDFIKTEGGDMELTTVNPVGVLGPVLGKSAGTSVEIVVKMLTGGLPFVPKLSVGWVDVRDVADLHIKAMLSPQAAGERYMAFSGQATLREIAAAVKAGLGDEANKVSLREVPNFIIKLAAYVDSGAALISGEVDHVKTASSAKAKTTLGWQPKTPDEAAVATARSCIQYGLA